MRPKGASEIPVDDERGANVQRAARESGAQDREQRVGILQWGQRRRWIHDLLDSDKSGAKKILN